MTKPERLTRDDITALMDCALAALAHEWKKEALDKLASIRDMALRSPAPDVERNAVIEAAANELVRLKGLKERIERNDAPPEELADMRDDYEGRKEPAWEALRRALKSPSPQVLPEGSEEKK